MKSLSGDTITPKFGEYNNYYETGTRYDLILFWVCDTIAIFKKRTQKGIYDINKINKVVGGDHG